MRDKCAKKVKIGQQKVKIGQKISKSDKIRHIAVHPDPGNNWSKSATHSPGAGAGAQGVVEASDYLTNKHDWVQLEEEITPPLRRALYEPRRPHSEL